MLMVAEEERRSGMVVEAQGMYVVSWDVVKGVKALRVEAEQIEQPLEGVEATLDVADGVGLSLIHI